jgi:hypothetical protein
MLYKQHMEYFSLGYLNNQNFMRETIEDVYSSNCYALSWLYDSVYPFDSYKAEKDSYLYNEAVLQDMENKADRQLSMYTDLI